MRMRQKSGDVQGMKDVYVQLSKVDTVEYLENVIAYILRNPLAAGVLIMPYHYLWSSAMLYFNPTKPMGLKMNDMSLRKRRLVTKSHMEVPDSYMVDENGMILPSCYVDVDAVEKIFRHPSRLLFLLKADAKLSFRDN